MREGKDSSLQNDSFSVEQVQRLVDIFKKLQKSIRGRFYESCKNIGLTVPQCTVVMHLIHMPEITLNELSDHLQLSPSTVSGIVERLVNQGIVIRETPKENRRTVKLSVSEDFIEKYDLMKLKEKIFLEIVEGVDPDIIEKVIDGMETFYLLLKRKEEMSENFAENNGLNGGEREY